MARNNTTVFWLLLLALAGAAPQLYGFINLDDAWLLDAARRFVSGEKLGLQVVETNPPLIIYLTSLAIIFAKVFDINAVHAFVIFTTLIGVLSLAVIFIKVKDTLLRLLVMFGFFILPNVAFGEREHFLMMLVLPYFIGQMQYEKPGLKYKIISGVLAGIGFSIKPFFPVIWLAIIACKWVADKKIFSIENFLIGAIGFGYLLYLYFIEQNYVAHVLPLLLKYYGTFGTNIFESVKQAAQLIFVYQVATLVLFVKDRKLLNREIYFSSAACIVSIIFVVIQQKTWLNYFYPPLFFSFLSNAFIIFAVFPHLKPVWNKCALAISCITIVALVSFSTINNLSMIYSMGNFPAKKMIRIFNKNADGKAVYALSFDLGAIYPAVIYSRAHNGSKYGHLWMLPGMYVGQKVVDGEMVYRKPEEMGADEAAVFNGVIGELLRDKPEIIAVSAFDRTYLNNGVEYKFDFVKYFGGDARFREFWREYKMVGRVDYQIIYRRTHSTSPGSPPSRG